MRNPERIKPFMQKFAHMWLQHVPDWRFGQLMSNFLGYVVSETRQDIFFIEDDKMEELMLKFFKGDEENSDECNLEISTDEC